MNEITPQEPQGYGPIRLLDALKEKLMLKNDAALARSLDIAPPVISKIRHGKLKIGATALIRMHEVSNVSIRELRLLLGETYKSSTR